MNDSWSDYLDALEGLAARWADAQLQPESCPAEPSRPSTSPPVDLYDRIEHVRSALDAAGQRAVAIQDAIARRLAALPPGGDEARTRGGTLGSRLDLRG